jgi:tetratricopeptide (TPR) repeat protein
MTLPGAIRWWRAGQAHLPPRPLLLAAAGGVLVVGTLERLVAPACIVIAGALITMACARDDRFLLGAALLAFGIRVVAALAFHWLAVLDVPALDSLRTAVAGGYRFWILAPDASWHHVSALQAVQAWRDGTELPTGTGPDYFIMIALIYVAFGPHPLNAVLWNALFGAIAVVAGYRIATRVAGASAARPSAILIALWPSGVLWSTQLLKDPLCLALVLVLAYLIMRAAEPLVASPARGWALARWGGLLLAVFVVTLLLHRFRHYIVQIFVPAPLVFIAYALARRTAQMPWRIVATGSVIAVMVAAASASRHVDLEGIFAPRNPQTGHTNLGVAHHVRGDLHAARGQYERALALAPDYPPPLKGLGTIALAQGMVPEAIAYYERYLALQPDDADVRRALDALRRLGPSAASPSAEADRRPHTSRVTLPAPPLLAPVLTPEPGPPKPHAITGPASDVAQGRRIWQYGKVIAGVREMRKGFIQSGGHSLMDADVELRDVWELLSFLPRALAHVLLAPYPWQWLDIGGATGAFRALSAVESLLLYLFLIPLLVGLGLGVRRGSPDAWFLTVFIGATMVLLGLVVTNLGTLFRLRLESLFPLFTTAGLGLDWLGRRSWRRS